MSSSNEENPDLSDIELIQHINVDTVRLIKLLNGKNNSLNLFSVILNKPNLLLYISETISKSKLLRKSVHLVLIASLEKAIWNWMDTYPHEFTEIQVLVIVLMMLVLQHSFHSNLCYRNVRMQTCLNVASSFLIYWIHLRKTTNEEPLYGLFKSCFWLYRLKYWKK